MAASPPPFGCKSARFERMSLLAGCLFVATPLETQRHREVKMPEEGAQVTPQGAVVVETPPQQPGAKPEAEAEVDWQQRAERAEKKITDSEAARQKLARDFESLKGTRQKTGDTYDLLQRLQEEMEIQSTVTARNTQALIEAVRSGDADNLATQVASNTAQTYQTRGDRQWQTQYAKMYDAAVEAAKTEEPLIDVTALRESLGRLAFAEDGTPLEDAEVVLMAPEFQECRTAWFEAAPQGFKTSAGKRDSAGLATALALVHRTVRLLERERGKTMMAKQLKEAREEARLEVLKETGALNLSGGKESGGGGGHDQELVNRMGRGAPMTLEELARASAALDKGVLPKR